MSHGLVSCPHLMSFHCFLVFHCIWLDISRILNGFLPCDVMLSLPFLHSHFKNVRHTTVMRQSPGCEDLGRDWCKTILYRYMLINEERRNAYRNGCKQCCRRKPRRQIDGVRLRALTATKPTRDAVAEHKPGTWQWFMGGRHLDQWPGLSATHPAGTGSAAPTIRFWRRMNDKTLRYLSIDPSHMGGVYISSCGGWVTASYACVIPQAANGG